jgi:hypothetical protein
MLHPIERGKSAVRDAVHAVRGWVHPRKVMKAHAFDRPLDDLGQVIEEGDPAVRPPAEPPEGPEQKH